jgi:hypothetical protein
MPYAVGLFCLQWFEMKGCCWSWSIFPSISTLLLKLSFHNTPHTQCTSFKSRGFCCVISSRAWVMVFNATVNNISWQSILLAEKTTDLPQVTYQLYHIISSKLKLFFFVAFHCNFTSRHSFVDKFCCNISLRFSYIFTPEFKVN